MARARTVVAFFLAFLLSVGAVVAEPKSKIKVGLILPLSGPVAGMASYALNGFKSEIDEAGADSALELFAEDDQFDPKRSVAAFEKLTTQNHVQVVLSLGSGPSNAIAPLAESKHIPFFALAGDNTMSRGRPSVIRMRITAEEEGELVAAEMKDNGAKRVILVCATNEYPLGVCVGVRKVLGDAVVHSVEVLPQETDFRSLVSNMRVKNADSIFLGLMPGKSAILAKQLREQKIDLKKWGTLFLYNDEEIKSADGALLGLGFVGPVVDVNFAESFSKKFGGGSSLIYAAAFSDVARILDGCGRKGVDVRSCFANLHQFPGAIGPIDFVSNADDRYLRFPFFLHRATEQGIIPVEP